MKKFLNLSIVLSACLLILSCGGGGGGGGGGAVSGGSSGTSGKAAVVVGINGLSMRSATRAAAQSVWDTLSSVDLTVYVDGESVFNKVLTPSDNVAVIEEVDVGSAVYATAIVTFNEANGGGTAEAKSDTIEVEPGSNNLTLAITYTYELKYCGKDNGWYEKTGTYTYASGIPIPADFSEVDEYGRVFSGWSADWDEVSDAPNGERDRTYYPKNLLGVRGNLSLMADYVEDPDAFTIECPGLERLYLYGASCHGDDSPYCYEYEDVRIIGQSTADGLSYTNLGTGQVSVHFDAEFGEAYAIFEAISEGHAKVRISKGNFSQVVEFEIESLLEISGTTLQKFKLPSTYDAAYPTLTYRVPSGITEIATTAVSWNNTVKNNISYVSLSDTSITTIPWALFEESGITGISFPDTLREISGRAFNKCYFLEGPIELPNQVNSIGQQAFRDCTGLSNISLPASLVIVNPNDWPIESNAFADSGLVTVYYAGTLTQWNDLGHPSGAGQWGGLETISGLFVNINGTDHHFVSGSNWIEFH